MGFERLSSFVCTKRVSELLTFMVFCSDLPFCIVLVLCSTWIEDASEVIGFLVLCSVPLRHVLTCTVL